MPDVDTEGIVSATTPYVVALYTVASLVFHKLAVLNFQQFDFALGQDLFSIGTLGVTLAGLLTVIIPGILYAMNDNEWMELTKQTWLMVFPVSTGFLMVVSPPIASAITGSLVVSGGLFAINLSSVGIMVGPNEL